MSQASTHRGSVDIEQVKSAADGRWPEILQTLAPALCEAVKAGPNRHVHCPLPHHPDKHPSFRLDKPAEGRAVCTCGSYDPWNLLELLQGWSFIEAVKHVAEFLGIGKSIPPHGSAAPSNAPSVSTPSTVVDPLARLATVKRCPYDSLGVYGATPFPDYKKVSFPMFDGKGEQCSQFHVWPDSANEKQRKGLNEKGKPTGLFLQVQNDRARLPQSGETWIVVEGVKDAAALHGIGHNAIGLPGKSCKPEWVPMFAGINVVVCLDNDDPGQTATPKLVKRLMGTAESVCTVTLPHPGDVRDNIAKGGVESVQSAIQQAADCDGDDEPIYRHVEVGTRVRPSDRDNIGEVISDNGPTCTVHFQNPDTGGTADLEFRKEDLRRADNGKRLVESSQAEIWPIEEYSARDLATIDFDVKYLVEDVLASNQPCIAGGPNKSLKTGVMLDLGISLVSGTDFLRRFRVLHRGRVGFMSGESGMKTLAETATRIATSKEINLADLGDALVITPELPNLCDDDGVKALLDWCERHKFDVVIIDPAYLSFPGLADISANVFAVGETLRKFSAQVIKAGVTPIIVHHSIKTPINKFEPLDLISLSGSGWAEFARQWILLNRRREYEDGTGFHELHLRIGGSAGHSGLWHLDVDEGVKELNTQRKWRVGLKTASQAREDRKTAADERFDREIAEKAALIIEHLRHRPGKADSQTAIGKNTAIGRSKAAQTALERLQQAGQVVWESDCVRKGGRNSGREGYRLIDSPEDVADQPPHPPKENSGRDSQLELTL